MSSQKNIETILETKFNKGKSNDLVKYFNALIQNLEQGKWEDSLSKASKFIEVTIKMVLIYAGQQLPANEKNFQVGGCIDKIMRLSDNDISSNGLRLQIPRACRFVYDITSNRGGRHHSDEFDPNEMDASTVSTLCSWILAELVRFCASNNLSIDEAHKLVISITERRYPIFEEIGDRIYVDNTKHKSAKQCALLILYKRHPDRISQHDLHRLLKKNGYQPSNCYKAVGSIKQYIDDDIFDGGIVLRKRGLEEAEKILQKSV